MSARQRLMKIMATMGPRRPRPVVERKKWNIVRGDKVEVIGNHRERGKQGIVSKMIRSRDKVIVKGVNIFEQRIKGDPQRGIEPRTIRKERSIPYCQVNLVDPVTGKPTRVSRKILDDGTKVRIAKKSGAIIPRPEILTVRRRPVNNIVTESDTLEDDVWAITYEPLSGSSST